MDEQPADSPVLLAPAAEDEEAAAEARPKPKPIMPLQAALLVLAGAIPILLILALLFSTSPAMNPLAAPTPTPAEDGFAAVRQASLDAFTKGKQYYDQGQFDLALIQLDLASVNDPDHRQ